jgi:hypothetical protein
MGVRLVVIIENVKKVSQEEINKAFGVHVFEYNESKDVIPTWELFEWEEKFMQPGTFLLEYSKGWMSFFF